MVFRVNRDDFDLHLKGATLKGWQGCQAGKVYRKVLKDVVNSLLHYQCHRARQKLRVAQGSFGTC